MLINMLACYTNNQGITIVACPKTLLLHFSIHNYFAYPGFFLGQNWSSVVANINTSFLALFFFFIKAGMLPLDFIAL